MSGNVNLADNDTVLHLRENLLENIDKNFEGVYAKLKTGFTKKTTSAEVGIVKKI